MRAKIKNGAAAAQDRSWFSWPGKHDANIIFKICASADGLNKYAESKIKCVAPGYGQIDSGPGGYGNGAVYVDTVRDLILVGEG